MESFRKHRLFRYIPRAIVLLLLSIPLYTTAHPVALTLQRSERIALQRAPELRQLQAQRAALEHTAITAGQLADPTLLLGAINLPTDTFNLDQEPMTQLQVGLAQRFPSGHSLKYRQLATRDDAYAEAAKAQLMRLNILRRVRLAWLDLYFWRQSRRIVLKQKRVFRRLFHVTRALLAHNKAQQKDVIRAQLEMTALDDRLLLIREYHDIACARLARWIGVRLAQSAQPHRWPYRDKRLSAKHIHAQLSHHPQLRIDNALIAARRHQLALAAEAYKPSFDAGVAYGYRDGQDIVRGKRRADFLSARVNVDLPLLTKNRQDQTVMARKEQLIASEKNRLSHYRQLRTSLRVNDSRFRQRAKSAWLYRRHLIPQAKNYAAATLIAYRNNQTDFPTLARSYVRELNIELAALSANVDREKAQVALLYLQGK